MLVNVILITYKQEEYIRPALESILSQDTSFKFNIIVADDSSPDNTLSIIKDYAKESEIDFVFLEKKNNMGFVKNYKRAFAACNAKYIAIMEGDDIWTRNKHLENHVQFLEEHTETSMSFNRHIRYFQSQDKKDIFEWNSDESYELLETKDQIFVNRIGNLSCCVFRTELIKKLKPEVYEIDFADWLLGMVMGQYGSLAYQKEITSLYRIHDDGQWTRMTDRERDKHILETIDSYDKALNYKFTNEFETLKKWKTINVYGDNSLRGRIKSMTPTFLRQLYRKIRN